MASYYIVSESPDRIEPANEEIPSRYTTAEKAGDAIKSGVHGDYGTRYVLWITTELSATYDRAWVLIPKEEAW